MTRNRSLVLAAVAWMSAMSFAGRSHAQSRSTVGSLELWHVEFGVMAPSLADARFEGSGFLPNATTPTNVSASGRQLGLVRPVLFAFGIHPTVFLGSHVYFGPFGDFGGGDGDAMPDATGQMLGAARGVTMYRVGGEIGTAWDIGRIEARAGVQAGERWTSVEMHGFQASPCRSGACYPSADTSQFFIQPRLMLGVSASLFVAGVFVGADVLPDLGFSGGVFLAARIPIDGLTNTRRHATSTPESPAVVPASTTGPTTVVEGPTVVVQGANRTTIVTTTTTTIVQGALPASESESDATIAPRLDQPQLEPIVPQLPNAPTDGESTEVPENPYVR